MFTQKQIDLFWSNVNIEIGGDGCWLWKLSKDRYGYGKVKIDQVVYGSHRVAYEIENGVIPNGLQVLHKCDNPACCNPFHLKIGTHTDNMKDMMEKGRRGKSSKPQKRLTIETVKSIKEDFKLGMSKHALERKYKVSCRHIRGILRGDHWSRI